MAGWRVAAGLLTAGLAGCGTLSPSPPPDAGTFFDDFSQPDAAALGRDGWIVRE